MVTISIGGKERRKIKLISRTLMETIIIKVGGKRYDK